MCIIEEIDNCCETSYYLSYDRKVFLYKRNKVLKQMMNIWDDVIKWLMVYRQFDIDTNPIMNIVSKLWFYCCKTNVVIMKEKRRRTYIKRRLSILKNRKFLCTL